MPSERLPKVFNHVFLYPVLVYTDYAQVLLAHHRHLRHWFGCLSFLGFRLHRLFGGILFLGDLGHIRVGFDHTIS